MPRNLSEVFRLLVIFASFKMSACESYVTNPKIVIVGAGAAGIAAASKLFENGFRNVTILEAENRIGGRVYTTEIGNYSVDLGGQWVHGEEGNVVFELANPLNILDKSEKQNYGLNLFYVDSLGNQLSYEIANTITKFYFDYVNNWNFGNDTSYESIGRFIEKMFDEKFKNVMSIYNEKKKFLHLLELFTISIDSADSWYNISAAGENQYKACPGDQLINWKSAGYKLFLDVLTKTYPNPEEQIPVMNNTILNSEVMTINYLKNSGEAPVLITTTNGQLYTADHVIVTVPLGVLKEKHKSLFIPPLPNYKVKTIESIGFGSVAKIYLLFEKPFWNLGEDRILHLTFLWNDAERKSIELDTEKMWVLGMSGAMTVEHKPNLLELWIAGKYTKIMETLSEDKVLNHTIENLHRFLNKKYKVTQPIAMLRSHWYTNPHFRGTYSYRSVETQNRKVFAEMLERPLTPQNLMVLFAGEATSNDRFSTVDGAVASGWKAANRLLNYYKNILPFSN